MGVLPQLYVPEQHHVPLDPRTARGWHLSGGVTRRHHIHWYVVPAWNIFVNNPDSKVRGANMGPIWGRQDPGGPHVGPMNVVIWEEPSIGLDNGLAPNRRQAIIWNNANPIHWRIYAALGGDELTLIPTRISNLIFSVQCGILLSNFSQNILRIFPTCKIASFVIG